MSKHYQATVYHQSKYFAQPPPHLSPPKSAAPGCTVERMCRLKGPLQPQLHCILYHMGRLCVILVDDVNSLKYHGAWSAARTKDIIICTVCVEEFHSQSLFVIWSCWAAVSVISYGSWSHFPLSLSPRLWRWRRLNLDFRFFLNTLSLLQCTMSLIQSWLTIMSDIYHISMLEWHTTAQSNICSRGTHKADFQIWAQDGLLARFGQWL